ncbi:DUF6086 family protein [Streptomyces sp. NBC_00385]|uniref:DUF6086 family protein n=1 Tax=Streptomyces sp. NBC_00385 TaxID=2975733 RepID=UPI002DDAD3C5|nr:DUF6086 family protein [Streptomyces sp. NBC_00385]WRZ03052.1 DUF6086 family protein [Streptomyces sp. NBC_00385]
MSKYFDMGGTTLWNPSNGAGRLFLRHVEVLEAELGLPSGIRQGEHAGDPDTVVLDRAVYAEFVHGLVAWHCRTRHGVILALSDGFSAVAVALARRAGIEDALPGGESGDAAGSARGDAQAPVDPRTAPEGVISALDRRAREMDRKMAR